MKIWPRLQWKKEGNYFKVKKYIPLKNVTLCIIVYCIKTINKYPLRPLIFTNRLLCIRNTDSYWWYRKQYKTKELFNKRKSHSLPLHKAVSFLSLTGHYLPTKMENCTSIVQNVRVSFNLGYTAFCFSGQMPKKLKVTSNTY